MTADFFCCSLNNRWLWNVIIITTHVLIELCFHIVIAFVTILLAIIVNVEMYRKSTSGTKEEKLENMSSIMEENISS